MGKRLVAGEFGPLGKVGISLSESSPLCPPARRTERGRAARVEIRHLRAHGQHVAGWVLCGFASFRLPLFLPSPERSPGFGAPRKTGDGRDRPAGEVVHPVQCRGPLGLQLQLTQSPPSPARPASQCSLDLARIAASGFTRAASLSGGGLGRLTSQLMRLGDPAPAALLSSSALASGAGRGGLRSPEP